MSTTFTREDLLAERKTGIGGSDIHRVFGLEPYGCARQLWYEKTGAEEEFESFEKKILARGNALEPIIAEMYAKKTGREVKVHSNAVRHPDHPELLVHIDRKIAIPPCPPEDSLAKRHHYGDLEIKTAGRDMFFKIKREGLPEAYILQLQHAMLCTGALWGSFALLWPDGWDLLWWDVERDQEIINLIEEEALSFWSLVQAGTPPDRLDIDDPRCGKCPYQIQCQGSAMQEMAARQGIGTERDASLAPLVAEYAEVRALLADAEEQMDGVKEELKAAMGDRFLVETPAGKVHFRPNREWDFRALDIEHRSLVEKFRTKIDWTAFDSAHPELEQHYKKLGTTRPLRVYPTKKK